MRDDTANSIGGQYHGLIQSSLSLEGISEVAFELFIVGNAASCVSGRAIWRAVLCHA